MQPRFCNYCGAALPEGAAFCPACRNSVAPAYAPPYAPPPPAYYEKPKTPGKGFGITAMILGILGAYQGLGSLLATVTMSNYPYWMFSYIDNSYLDPAQFIKNMIFYVLLLCIVLYAVPSVLALVFGNVARKRGYRNGISLSGVILGGVGIGLCAVALVVLLVTQ